jgi:hypothetical protein
MTVVEVSPVITLRADPELRAKLERKLEEYRQRYAEKVAELGEDTGFRAPEIRCCHLGQAPYRVFILERLLRDGRIETWSLSREIAEVLKKDKNEFDSEYFDKSCAVIKAYAENGGAGLVEGTGLK